MNKTAQPHSVTLSARPLSPASTLSTLNSFLTATESSAYLHPDSYITPGGISYSTTSGPSGGLTLSQLRRIVAGLSGEVLAPDPSEVAFLEEDGKFKGRSDDARLDGEIERTLGKKRPMMNELNPDGTPKRSALKKRRLNLDTAALLDSEGEVLGRDFGDGEEMDVQVNPGQDPGEDPEQYALKQRELVGDIGDRGSNNGKMGGAPPRIIPHQELDKEARKLEKKRRQKAEKREKEERRAAG